jgi:hypothetical protein
VLIWKGNKVIIVTVEIAKYDLNEIDYNPATSTYLSVVYLVLKSPNTQTMLLHVINLEINAHHKQMNVEYYYVEKEI